jgi:hypothetical protein
LQIFEINSLNYGKITDPDFLDFSTVNSTSSANPIDFQMDEEVEEFDIAPQREIKMQSSDESSDEEEDNRDVDIDDI